MRFRYDGYKCDSYSPTATAFQVPQLYAISAGVHVDAAGLVLPLQRVHACSDDQC
jgi:hypothetical protein